MPFRNGKTSVANGVKSPKFSTKFCQNILQFRGRDIACGATKIRNKLEINNISREAGYYFPPKGGSISRRQPTICSATGIVSKKQAARVSGLPL